MIKKLKIEKPVYGGDFISFDDDKTYFTPYVLPNETAETQIITTRKNSCFTNLKKIIQSSSSRIPPECENFAVCGGCSYLHTDYNTELAFKKQIIIESLERIAGFNFTSEIETISGPRFHYRSHAGIKVKNGACGFYKKDSNTISAFPEKGCLLLDKKIIEFIKNGNFQKDFKAAVNFTNDVITEREKSVTEKVNDYVFEHKLNDFFQSNLFLRGKMLNIINEMTEKFSEKDTLLDLGCGTGFFSIPMSKYYGYTLGVDIEKSNIKSAIKNKSLNKTGKLFFETNDMDMINPSAKHFSTVIADPPRAGLTPEAVNKILGFSPKNFIYVSCNPSTWARDLRQFIENKYSLNKLIFIDMFPGTHHIEIISLLERNA